MQDSHASWKVLDFFLKIPGPGKSWKITLGQSWKNILENHAFSSGSSGKQAEMFIQSMSLKTKAVHIYQS